MNWFVGIDTAAPGCDRSVTICNGCGMEIDPETCCCGDAKDGHGYGSGHGFVPMGCVCGYVGRKPSFFSIGATASATFSSERPAT